MAESQTFIDRYSTMLPEPHCDHCGVGLAGLPEDGVCPECGTNYDSVATSLPRQIDRGRVAIYLVAPLALALGACICAGIINPETTFGFLMSYLFFLPAAPAIAWFGWRVGRASTLLFTRCMPRRNAEGPVSILVFGAVQFFGFSTMLLGLLSTGVVITIGFILVRRFDF